MKNIISISKILCLIFVSIIFLNFQYPSEDNLIKIFENKFNNYKVLNYRKGNFTNSKLDEYVVFFNDIFTHKVIGKVVVFILKNNDIKNLYELKVRVEGRDINVFSLDYSVNKYNLETIKKVSPQLGTWNDYCYLNDFNENGLDEILFFELSGRALIPYIFEFKDNKIQPTLDITTVHNDSITEIKTVKENGKKIIKIYGIGYNVSQKGKIDYYKYSWDSGKQIYSFIEKGIE
jgi:hypothetical protein